MYGYAQPRSVSATALLYVAAALRTAAHQVRAAARRLDATGAKPGCESGCDPYIAEADHVRELDGLAHLNGHVLKDIGAPNWLVAHAAGERDREHLRWLGLEHR